MSQLVSVIIPCYNAERWIREAIDSCLAQTYRPLEVIAIDDGSTDRSLEIIQSFGDAIRWETGPNRGGNHARNRGLALSKGEYIQFLDADDLLRPEKIERQINAFNGTAADVVYGDWQRLDEHLDGTTTHQRPDIAGPQSDVLEALLGCWAPPPCAFLFKRHVVERVGGWNERMAFGQDWELNIRIALSGARYEYLPGCQSVYRRSTTPTVSMKESDVMHQMITSVPRNAEETLQSRDQLHSRYRRAMAASYFAMARTSYERDRIAFDKFLAEAQRLSKSFAYKQNFIYRAISSIFGANMAERLAVCKRWITGVNSSPRTGRW